MKHHISQRFFGKTPSGEEVSEYTLTNEKGLEMRVINYGCTITSLSVPDRNGVNGDIVLGYDTLEEYLDSTHYLGCIVGRCAGRIANGSFDLEGKKYTLAKNQLPHHLHGGIRGFDKVVWEAKPFENELGVGMDFHYQSPDGEEGYPGNLALIVRYFLTHENVLLFQYAGQTDLPTIINLTQHSYFNLSVEDGTILKHGLFINADYFLPLQSTIIPTGEKVPVHGTPFDFTSPELVANAFLLHDAQTAIGRGVDHCWVLNKTEEAMSHAATLFDPASGRMMDIFTSEPGLQVYTGNHLEGVGKKGKAYAPYSGIALETQHFPDAPNQKKFPSIVIYPNEKYSSKTILRFSVQED